MKKEDRVTEVRICYKEKMKCVKGKQKENGV